MNPVRERDLGTPGGAVEVTAVQVAPAMHRSSLQDEFDERTRKRTRVTETT